MRTLGWPHPIRAQAWDDLRDQYRSAVTGWLGLAVMAEIVDSVIEGGAVELLAATTSMRDLIVVSCPIPEPPLDVILIRAPRNAAGDTIVVEHLAVTGRNDRLERPVGEAVPLFWRFVLEKFGVVAPIWSSTLSGG